MPVVSVVVARKVVSLECGGLTPLWPRSSDIDNKAASGRRTPRRRLCQLRNNILLNTNERLNSTFSKSHQFVHLPAAEGLAFRSTLKLDKSSITSANDIHIHFGLGIFVVLQIEERRASNDSHANCCHLIYCQRARDLSDFEQLVIRNCEGDEGASDRRSARAAISLEDVAIDRDRTFTECFHVCDCAQTSADKSLYFVCAAG